MKPTFLDGIRARLALLVLLITVPILLLTLSSGFEHRGIAADQAKSEAQGFARLVRDQQLQLVQSTGEVLSVIAREEAIRRGDLAASARYLADVQRDFGAYTVFFLAEPSGKVVSSSAPLPRPVDLSDREYLRRAVQSRRFSTGQYVVGRLTGQTTLPMARPVLDDSGRVRHVLVTGLSLSWLERMAATAALPEASRILILSEDGTILARYPDPGKLVGKSLPDAELIRNAISGQEGARELTGLDGVRRLYGFASLQLGPNSSYIAVGIPTRAAYAGADRILRASVRNVCAVILLAILGTWFFGRKLIVSPLRNLLAAIGRVENGDLAARSGLRDVSGEIGEVAAAFDRMAESLETRRREEEALISELRHALGEVKTLRGFIPICASCKKIRDDQGYWNKLEAYLSEHTSAEFTHGLCPECVRKHYPEHAEAIFASSTVSQAPSDED